MISPVKKKTPKKTGKDQKDQKRNSTKKDAKKKEQRIDLMNNTITDLKLSFVILACLVERSNKKRKLNDKCLCNILSVQWNQFNHYINYKFICSNTNIKIAIIIKDDVNSFYSLFISPEDTKNHIRTAFYFNPIDKTELPQDVQQNLLRKCQIKVDRIEEIFFDKNKDNSCFYVIHVLYQLIIDSQIHIKDLKDLFELRREYQNILNTKQIFLYPEIHSAYNEFSHTFSPREHILNNLINLTQLKLKRKAI